MPKDIQNDSLIVKASPNEAVSVPDSGFITDAEFHRHGQDLHLVREDGQTIIVEGYFDQTPPPSIESAAGAHLSPELVTPFLITGREGQYAEANAGTVTDATSAIGRITEVVGRATITHADGTKTEAVVGSAIRQGDVIETDASGAVNIVFADNTSFAISESAKLSIDEYTFNSGDQSGQSFFSMLRGMFVYTSGLIGKSDPADVNINTPVGSIGIRGTVVAGTIDPDGGSKITVIDGAVVVTNGSGSVELNDQFETAALASYNEPPANTGQMSASQFSQTYAGLGHVAGDTFRQSGVPVNAPTQDNKTQDPTQQVAPDDGQQTAPSPASDTGTDAGGTTTSPETQDALPPAGESIVDPKMEDGQSALPPPEEGTSLPPPGDASTIFFMPPPPPPPSEFTNDATFDSGYTDPYAGTTTAPPPPSTTASSTNGSLPPPPPPPPPPTNNTSSGGAADVPLAISGDSVPTMVREFLEQGTIVGRVFASSSQPITFSIVGGNSVTSLYRTTTAGPDNGGGTGMLVGDAFTIDATTGEIRVFQPLHLNFHHNSTFSLVVEATDGRTVVTHTVNFNIGHPGVSGMTPGGFPTFIGTSGNDDGISNNVVVPPAQDLNEVLYGGDGNDLLSGEGGDMSIGSLGDFLYGGAGNDKIQIGNAGIGMIDGGSGMDTLILGDPSHSPVILNFVTDPTLKTKVRNIEAIDLAGSSTSSGAVSLSIADVFEITGGNGSNTHILTVKESAVRAGGVVNLLTGDAWHINSPTGTLLTTGTITQSDGTAALNLYGSFNGQTVQLVIQPATTAGPGGITISTGATA